MKPVKQTKSDAPELGINGNCMAACFASLLEIPLDEVPKFENLGDDWYEPFKKWLAKTNRVFYQISGKVKPRGFAIAVGTSPRGKPHAIICKGGDPYFDPHPDGGGLAEFENFWVILKEEQFNFSMPK